MAVVFSSIFGCRYIVTTAVTDMLIAKDSGEALAGDSYYVHMINVLTWAFCFREFFDIKLLCYLYPSKITGISLEPK